LFDFSSQDFFNSIQPTVGIGDTLQKFALAVTMRLPSSSSLEINRSSGSDLEMAA
jgi:hypothetical protein